MRMIDFRRPGNLQEACAILAELGPQGMALAGATSLVFMGANEERVAVDINRIGLADIQRVNGSFRIGALARIADLQAHEADGWVLKRVAVHLASQQIRNMSTLGGNITRVFPWADFPVALLALDATVVVSNGSAERNIPAREFFDGQPLRLLKAGELVVRVEVPAIEAGEGFGYLKNRLVATGFSMVTAAAYLRREGDRVAEARVALGAGVPFPTRATEVETALAGKAASEAALREAAAKGLGALKFREAEGRPAEYIAHLAEVAVGDALVEAWLQAKGS